MKVAQSLNIFVILLLSFKLSAGVFFSSDILKKKMQKLKLWIL
jgi:hypothetical protein